MSQVRDTATGRYAEQTRCDRCGKSCPDDHGTDDAVCGLSDDPGFYICGRVRCGRRVKGASVETRRELYTRQRAETSLALSEGRQPSTVEVAS
jgi:hypothetical protein